MLRELGIVRLYTIFTLLVSNLASYIDIFLNSYIQAVYLYYLLTDATGSIEAE